MKRIQVYADEETKRRIELAAMIREVPVTEYCLDAITQQLRQDDVLEQSEILVRLASGTEEDLMDDLRALRGQIRARRGEIDVHELVDQVRAERDDELLGLH